MQRLLHTQRPTCPLILAFPWGHLNRRTCIYCPYIYTCAHTGTHLSTLVGTFPHAQITEMHAHICSLVHISHIHMCRHSRPITNTHPLTQADSCARAHVSPQMHTNAHLHVLHTAIHTLSRITYSHTPHTHEHVHRVAESS